MQVIIQNLLVISNNKCVKSMLFASIAKVSDTTKELMSSPKCRSVEVINNPARPGSNHIEVNYINYK